jgi:hypothetical protein
VIVDEQGNTPSYPIRQCTRCGNSTCKLAEDSKGGLLFWLSTGQYVDWPDVQSLPGWVNGWPTGMGQSKGATWRRINFVDSTSVQREPIKSDQLV